MVATEVTSPYVGAHSFTEMQRSVFFGRERDLRELRRLVIAERIVLLYSPSGAGKTSLLRAGLTPALRKDGFTVRPIMRVSSESTGAEGHTPVNRFVMSALVYLYEGLPEDQRAGANPTTMGEITFKGYLEHLARGGDGETDEVLIFDQFEEILKIDPGSRAAHRERLEFFRQVGEALTSRRRWAVFSLREDYLAGLDPYRRAIPTRLGNHFRLDLLRVDDARRAIAMPPQDPAFGVTIADAAVDRLLEDLASADALGGASTPGAGSTDDALYIEPLHLQVVCDRLWRETHPSPGDEITIEQIGTCGEVDVALQAFYDDGVRRVASDGPGRDEQAIRDWFEDELIIGADGIRGQVPRREPRSGSLDTDIADALVKAKLVNQETRLDIDWYELSHDRLIRPVRASNAHWFGQLPPFQKRAHHWARSGQQQSDLLGPASWLRAWIETRKPGVHLRDYERRYLRASGARFRWPVVAGAGILLAMVLTFAVARSLGESETITWSRALAAAAIQDLPDDEQKFLPNALLAAVAAVDIAGDAQPPLEASQSLLRSLVFRPGYARPMVFTDAPASASPTPVPPGTGALNGTAAPASALAISTDDRYVATIAPDGSVSILDIPPLPAVGSPAAPATQRNLGVGADPGDIIALAFVPHPDHPSGVLAIGHRDGTVALWDIASDRSLGSIEPPSRGQSILPTAGPTTGMVHLAGAPNGFLAGGFPDGTIRIWDLSSPGQPAEVASLVREDEADAAVSALAFAPPLDGGAPRTSLAVAQASSEWTLVAGYDDGQVYGWSSAGEGQDTGGELGALPSGGAVRALAIGPQGWVAFGGEGGFMISHSERTTPSLNAAVTVTSLAFDPASNALVSGHENGEVRRWSLGTTPPIPASGVTGEPTLLGEQTQQPVTNLAFPDDRRWLLSLSDGTPVPALWNPDMLPPIAFSVNARAADLPLCPREVAFAGDGQTILITGLEATPYATAIAAHPPTSSATPGGTPLPRDPRACGVTARRTLDQTRAVFDGDKQVWADDVTRVLGLEDDLLAVLVTSAISDDRRLLATGYSTGEIRLWILGDDGWRRYGDLPGHGAPVASLSFTRGATTYLASVGLDGHVVLWDLTTDNWVDYACARAGYRFDPDDARDLPSVDRQALEDLRHSHPCNQGEGAATTAPDQFTGMAAGLDASRARSMASSSPRRGGLE